MKNLDTRTNLEEINIQEKYGTQAILEKNAFLELENLKQEGLTSQEALARTKSKWLE